MDNWRKVKKETIVNCFAKCGFNEATLELFIDDDADAEFAGLQNHISDMPPESTVDFYLNQDEDAITSVNAVDIRSINWKENLREKTICCAIENDDRQKNKLKLMTILALNNHSSKYGQVKLPYVHLLNT